jgi:tRNA dimethylallyltransferase
MSGDDPLAYLAGGLLGPTGVGKTDVALELASRHGLEILSVESRQIYRQLEIGTAKPTAEERARVPHHLLDLLAPTEACSAGRFRDLALAALRESGSRGVRLLGVGGAGLYWEALVQGLHDLPPASAEIRARHARVRATEGLGALYRHLSVIDPETAARLEPGDTQRICRALEVAELAGRPLSELLRLPRPDARAVPTVALTRDRADLYRRIEARGHAMLAAGLVEEVRGLLAGGVPPDAPGLRTLGYREFLPHLLEGRSLGAGIDAFILASRHYAKRQETWFRRRPEGVISVEVGPDETAAAVATRVEAALGWTS